MNIFLIILAIIVLPILGWLLWKVVRRAFWYTVSWLWFGVEFVGILWAHWHPKREVIAFRDAHGKLHRVYKD